MFKNQCFAEFCTRHFQKWSNLEINQYFIQSESAFPTSLYSCCNFWEEMRFDRKGGRKSANLTKRNVNKTVLHDLIFEHDFCLSHVRFSSAMAAILTHHDPTLLQWQYHAVFWHWSRIMWGLMNDGLVLVLNYKWVNPQRNACMINI